MSDEINVTKKFIVRNPNRKSVTVKVYDECK